MNTKNLFSKSYIKKNGNNKHYSIYNGNFNVYIFKIDFLCSNIHKAFLKRYANIKLNIANTILIVNNLHENFGLLVYSGTMKAAPNHPADRLTNKSEIIPNQTALNIQSTITTMYKLVKLFYGSALWRMTRGAWQQGFLRITKKLPQKIRFLSGYIQKLFWELKVMSAANPEYTYSYSGIFHNRTTDI